MKLLLLPLVLVVVDTVYSDVGNIVLLVVLNNVGENDGLIVGMWVLRLGLTVGLLL